MFSSFLYNIELYVRQHRQFRTVYFHNLGRFDGFFLLKHYSELGATYRIKTLIRNSTLYEWKMRVHPYYCVSETLWRFLWALLTHWHTLYVRRELGCKGSLPHADLCMGNLLEHREDILCYLRQDILLLGGVMKKAQAINWSSYEIDVESVLTISSLSFKIFRKKSLNEEAFQIKIPTQNQDTFIRRGYYGGHVDVYNMVSICIFMMLTPYILLLWKPSRCPQGPRSGIITWRRSVRKDALNLLVDERSESRNESNSSVYPSSSSFE